MEINYYQQAALRTEAPKRVYTAPRALLAAFARMGVVSDPDEQTSLIRLLEGLMGMNGEAGEASDILKKVLFQGHKLDREHMAKELGDVCWYIALAADAIGYTLEEVMQMNIDKLYARYPNGFETERSVNREDGDV